ncbi:hypothetical protein PUNSTDRAFT_48141 [Punctularia strigosozonata HHB-11173 SS5]|uniref:Uncharacterized protein n=1 Tax=Punctularia strigosozonata (strain HHB-11173) TaxID=741275 RepID=R7S0M5_PUNST|nr:uncharacterized protein PUNSTDRAFT_48141 [Punctularia strigosozonata HHB-11173 SS5]EIN03352.1 hypothetical protein PUNSTDRAFT_48141 [Punctularia strigosozonata HHB-11173 SS5]
MAPKARDIEQNLFDDILPPIHVLLLTHLLFDQYNLRVQNGIDIQDCCIDKDTPNNDTLKEKDNNDMDIDEIIDDSDEDTPNHNARKEKDNDDMDIDEIIDDSDEDTPNHNAREEKDNNELGNPREDYLLAMDMVEKMDVMRGQFKLSPERCRAEQGTLNICKPRGAPTLPTHAPPSATA